MPLTFLLIVFLLIILLQMTTDFYVPAMPQMAEFFHASAGSVQLTFSIFLLGMSLSHLIFAPMSDKYGRKKSIFYGVILSTVGSVICCSAPSLNYLILGRFTQGLGIGCCNSVGRAMVRDVFDGEKLAKIGSCIGMLSILILIASPVLGGYVVTSFDWQMNFLMLACLGGLISGLIIKFLPETNQRLNPNAIKYSSLFSDIYVLIRNKEFIYYTLCSCLAASGLMAWFTMSSFVLTTYFNLNPIEIGSQNLYIALAVFCSGLVNLSLVGSLGIKTMVKGGTCLMLLSGAVLWCLLFNSHLSLPALMVSIALFSTGAGLVFINDESLEKTLRYYHEQQMLVTGIVYSFDKPDASIDSINELLNHPLDAVILNAFSRQKNLKAFHECPIEEFTQYIQLNIQGHIRLLHHLLPSMLAHQFGRIILLSSASVALGTKKYGAYCTSKAALEGLIINLAVEYSAQNVLSNIVRLGLMQTSRTKLFWRNQAYLDHVNQIIPQGCMGTACQAAEALDSLLSKTSYITGNILNVSGGLPLFNTAT